MKNLSKSIAIMAVLLGMLSMACTKPTDVEAVDGTPSSPPAGVAGKWTYGTFSPSSFWGTDGSYQGAASEQAMAFQFRNDGTYEMYVINATTYYGCRTAAYTYWKGKATFNQADRSITLVPVQGTQRGEFGCASGKNFKRDASAEEMANAHRTYSYGIETDVKGQPALRLYLSDTDKQGAQLTKGNW